jgi:hypothetical protein
MNCEIVFSIQEFLKVVPGIIIFPLSFFLAWKKIGVSVSFSYSFNMDNLGGRFTSLVLVNNKDKPVIINKITIGYAGVNFVLDEFIPPLILKPYEAILVQPKDYSYLEVKNELWEIPYTVYEHPEIYIQIPTGIYKCNLLGKAKSLFKVKLPLTNIAKKFTFNSHGKVYNPYTTLYVIVYKYESQTLVTFVEKSGFITDATGLPGNMLQKHELGSPEIVEATLRRFDPTLQIKVLNVISQ